MKRSDFEKLSLDRQRVGFMLTTDERKQIYKELKLQEKGIIPAPIKNITLNKYFEIIKEGMLALCDEDGFYLNLSFGCGENERINIKEMSPKDVAKRFMDGRSLFHSDYGDSCGILADIDHNSPEQFKWWIANAVYGGHPWETRFGNVYVCPIYTKEYSKPIIRKKRTEEYSDYSILYISKHHRVTPWAFRVFLRLRNLGYPVIWEIGDRDSDLLSKRYFTDLSNQPKWLQISEDYFRKKNII